MSTNKASPKNIIIFLDRASFNIIFAISIVVLEVCTAIFPLSYVVFLRLYTLFWYFLAASFTVDEVPVPAESMPKSEAAAVVSNKIVHASDQSNDAVIETKYEELHELHDQERFLQRFLFKVRFN